jgi:hypothetical protein
LGMRPSESPVFLNLTPVADSVNNDVANGDVARG